MSEANFKIMYHILGEQTIPAFLAAIQYPADIKHYILTTKSVKTQLAAKNLQAAFNRRGYVNELFYIGEEAAAVSSFHLIPEIEKIMSNTNPDNLPACAEVTGGTKLMFYAMIVAARERKMTIIYVDTANRQLQYLNNGSVATLEQSLTLDDFMTLSGCKFCKPGVTTYNEAEEALAEFFYKHSDLIQRVQETAAYIVDPKKGGVGQNKEKAEALLTQLKSGFFKNDQAQFQVLWDNYCDVKAKKLDAQMRFIAGEWFECLVYSKLRKNLPGIKEIRRSSEVSYMDDNKTMQEFDVIYTDGYSLVILECKAGKVVQDHIQKLENLRSAFSGALGKCALVTLNPSTTKNNRAQMLRIKNSKAIAAFCAEAGINKLPSLGFTFRTGQIYEN